MTSHLARGEHISADAATPEELADLRPDEVLAAELEALYEDGDYEASEDARPVDAGNAVSGEPWGWFRTQGQPDEESPWRLVPLALPDIRETIVNFSAWQSESMTGASLASGAAAAGDIVIDWFDGDEEGRFVDVTYRDVDAGQLVLGAVSNVLEGGGPLCPEHPDGWELSLDVSPSVDSAIVQRAVGEMWRPCQQHPDAVVEVSGQLWGWTGESWVPDQRG